MMPRTSLLLERFHQVKGIYPVIYMSNRRIAPSSSQGLPIQITHSRNTSITAEKRIQRLRLFSRTRRRKSALKPADDVAGVPAGEFVPLLLSSINLC